MHKDYIGSILAISDEAGNKVEQRHFDAWGNFTHLKIGMPLLLQIKHLLLKLLYLLTEVTLVMNILWKLESST